MITHQNILDAIAVISNVALPWHAMVDTDVSKVRQVSSSLSVYKGRGELDIYRPSEEVLEDAITLLKQSGYDIEGEEEEPAPLARSELFTLKIYEVLDALHEGHKLQCEEWYDSEFIRLSKNEDLVDENGKTCGASVLIMNRDLDWRVLP